MQVAARAVGSQGRVVGVDRVALDPPLEEANAFAFVGDLEDPDLPAAIRARLGGLADGVLCDAAPKLTGVRPTDRAMEERLLLAVEGALAGLLRPGGWLVLKLLDSPEAQEVARRLRRRFESAKIVRTRATRSGSSERYWAGRGFRG